MGVGTAAIYASRSLEMNVLVTGAGGFLGRHLVRALLAAGHDVVGCGRDANAFARHFPSVRFIVTDFAVDRDLGVWVPRLANIDVVINAVGIFRERGAQGFAAIHTHAPTALFEAAVHADVRRVIQISALGADAGARNRYHLSKKAADDRLRRLDIDWAIVQPSLIYGAGGTSTRLFDALASLPVIPVPGDGEQQVQPIHIDDVIAALLALVRIDGPLRRRIALVGPEPLSLRRWLAQLRAALGLPATRFVSVPLPIVRVAARVGEFLPRSLLTRESLAMLLRGNIAAADSVTALLGHAPRPVRDFIAPEATSDARRCARLSWVLPLLSLSIALVWIASGIVSLGIYPVEHSYQLLARVGVIGVWAPWTLYGAAGIDIALGIATLAMRRRKRLWQVQMALVIGYSVAIAWMLPEFWLHPFGPLTKNLPLLAGLLALLVLEE